MPFRDFLGIPTFSSLWKLCTKQRLFIVMDFYSVRIVLFSKARLDSGFGFTFLLESLFSTRLYILWKLLQTVWVKAETLSYFCKKKWILKGIGTLEPVDTMNTRGFGCSSRLSYIPLAFVSLVISDFITPYWCLHTSFHFCCHLAQKWQKYTLLSHFVQRVIWKLNFNNPY